MVRIWMVAPVGLALALGACGNTQEEQAASGGLGGAATGALLGGPVGAVIGAGIGAAGGAYGEEAIEAVRDQEPEAPSSQQIAAPDMERGDIRNIQTTLQQMGYYDGQIDGLYGPKTRRAVAQYQIRQGLPETGQLSQRTVQSLQQTAMQPDMRR